MGEGRSRRVQECYSFEVAVDRGAGLLVAASVTQDPSDNARLEPLVAQAQAHESEGVKAADADSGYFSGGALGRLIRAGVDTCVPDCNTALGPASRAAGGHHPGPGTGERGVRV